LGVEAETFKALWRKITMSAETRARVDRDVRRESILDVAAEVFMAVGFSAASMSEIAARVGGSKGTLYNYFKNKEDLFEAYIQRYCAFQQEAMDELLSRRGDMRATLMAVGRSYMDVSISERGIRNFTLIAAESHRAPEIGLAFYEAGPRRGAQRLIDFMSTAVADGRLRPCDPTRAAYQFIALCQNRLLKACLCNAIPLPGPEEIDAEVEAGVDTFLAAFGPRPESV
jgi:AcrR family transcriptional regulator